MNVNRISVKKITYRLLSVLIIGIFLMPSPTMANSSTLNNLIKQNEKIKKQREEVKKNISNSQSQITTSTKTLAQVKKEIVQIDNEINNAILTIDNKEDAISQTEKSILELNTQIEDIEDRIESREDVMRKRLRSIQLSGGSINYIELIFGSKSFGDLVERLSAVQRIVGADQEILDQQNNDKVSLQSKRDEVETQKKILESQLIELESLKQDLVGKKAKKDVVVNQLKDKIEDLHDLQLDLEEQNKILASQEKAIVIAIEAERKRLEDLKKQGSSVTVSDSTFLRPTAGRVSSEYAFRWGSFHYGIDIAKSGDENIIYASANGVIIRSYYSKIYGNVVFMTHSINGKIFTTVYAHMNSRSVSEGQIVLKGQKLGIMGNTGYSTGQHLHFEIHEGEWNFQKSNSVNPRKYINF